MQVIAINGVGGSGKDTFVGFCNREVPCAVISTIDPVKQMLVDAGIYVGTRTALGWVEEVKGPKERKLLSDIKISLIEYNDMPFTATMDLIKELSEHTIVFVMVREFDEMLKFVNSCGAKTMLVTNDRVVACETEQMFVDSVPHEYKWDFIIENNGTLAELQKEAQKFISIIS